MRKNFVSILVIVAMFCMQLFGTKIVAANIDEATARQLGTYYLSVMSGGKVAEESQISLAYKFMNPKLNIPAAYIFNVENQGFVIVSGSDLWYPILGYSTEGLLDTNCMAPAFEWYFGSLCEYIIYSQNTGEPLIKDIEHEWDELRYGKLPEMKNAKAEYWLMDGKWGQGSVGNPSYNKFCPHKNVDGFEQTAFVGCVATAMSQIMHYWQYPVNPVADYIGYACELDSVFYEDVEIDMSQVMYNYSLMPDKLTSTSSEEEIEEVAKLCYHAGVSVEMGYGIMASYAWSHKVAPAMRDVFLFDSTVEYVTRTESKEDDSPRYTNEEWDAMMSAEIAAGRPMYYSGYSLTGEGRDAGGHAFVCDGKHPSNGKYHFNWGWDGQPNVWSDVRNNEVNVYNYDFKVFQEMVRYIQPRGGSEGIVEGNIELLPAYPNPTVGSITIPFHLKNQDACILSIYNVEGRLVDVVELNPTMDKVVIDVADYPKGLYIYRIGEIAKKFVVK